MIDVASNLAAVRQARGLSQGQLAERCRLQRQQIAQHTTQQQMCLEIIGHTSRTGPEPLNERLSLGRAEDIQARLAAAAPPLRHRIITSGKGSRENLIGIATDDARDALDRRVEFNVIRCSG